MSPTVQEINDRGPAAGVQFDSSYAIASATSIVIPAFNEGQVISSVITALRAAADWHEIVVVDDGSQDDTAVNAESAGARVIRQPYNKGNGAAVKAGIRSALGKFILIVDGDGQHKPEDAVRLIERLRTMDLVVGARSASTQANIIRGLGNKVLNWIASYLTGRHIPDLTSGMRAARTECFREFIHLLPNGFSTPTTTTLAFIRAGYSVAFEPIQARQRVGKSKIKLARDGMSFLLILMKIMTVFSPLRIFLPVALSSFAVGAGYAVWTVAMYSRVTNSSVLLILFAVLVFLIGLVSEQISALRFQR